MTNPITKINFVIQNTFNSQIKQKFWIDSIKMILSNIYSKLSFNKCENKWY